MAQVPLLPEQLRNVKQHLDQVTRVTYLAIIVQFLIIQGRVQQRLQVRYLPGNMGVFHKIMILVKYLGNKIYHTKHRVII